MVKPRKSCTYSVFLYLNDAQVSFKFRTSFTLLIDRFRR